MTDFKRFTVTAALPYANGPVHIGHLAGAYLPADIYVRWLRSQGKDVAFICGSDEHGVPITIKARKEGITPQEVVDRYHNLIKQSFADFGISFDIYSRTSNPIHHQTSSDFFKHLYEKGVFTEEETEQFYDEDEKQFLADRYIMGTCPKCGNKAAYGDQCEKCGSSLNPTDLIEPVSMLSGKPPVLRTTKNWFLPLDALQKSFLNDFVASRKNWKTNVMGQCKSWLNDGLQPRAMTRDLDWGVKVPIPGVENKVLYVWFDAPIGYISATRELFPDNWEQYWKDPETRLVHFIGKDNIVFHCIIFPAMLHVHGGYILPDAVPANEFLNLEGDKISTSRNHAIWLHEYLQDFPNRRDELRYVLNSIAPETKDADFTWKDFQARVNNELVAILGNFVNRVLVLSHKYFDGKVLPYHAENETDKALLTEVKASQELVNKLVSEFKFREAQFELMNIVRAGNKFITDQEPWHLIKTDENRVADILNTCVRLIYEFATTALPFLPDTSNKIFNFLNADIHTSSAHIYEVKSPELLFIKIEDKEIELQLEKLNQQAQNNQVAAPEKALEPIKPSIVFDDFVKTDIRVATVIAAEKVEKADKLLKLTLDTGVDQRTVVSGIAEHYGPEEVVGRQVCLLANLEPRKLRGIESQGMILMTEDAEGRLLFVSPSSLAQNGATVR